MAKYIFGYFCTVLKKKNFYENIFGSISFNKKVFIYSHLKKTKNLLTMFKYRHTGHSLKKKVLYGPLWFDEEPLTSMEVFIK